MLLWCDGFDHYGTDETNMTDGVYAVSGGALSTSAVATGTHSYQLTTSADVDNTNSLRKVLPASETMMGVAGRFYFSTLSSSNSRYNIIDFLSSTPTRSQVSVTIDANGCLRFLRGRGYFTLSGENGTLIAQSDPIVTAGAHNHIEVQVYIHDSAGWVRAAVNGVHRFEATGLDTKYDTSNIVSIGHSLGISGGSGGGTYYIDDLYFYDFSGDSAVDTDFCPTTDGVTGVATNYIGELQCMYLPPNADTAEDDWVPSSGSDAYAMVDEVSPNDADYISSSTATDLTELALTDLPVEITYVRGLQLLGRMSKSDSGAAMVQFGMKSVAATDDEAERPVTTSPTYYWDFMNVDPNSSARWTRASLNAAWFRLTRSV